VQWLVDLVFGASVALVSGFVVMLSETAWPDGSLAPSSATIVTIDVIAGDGEADDVT
jgi:hypothetical protein